ncbi:MAG TPA: transglycosylase SLT domain-containing protein, partial [Xanthomonadales bacterium]|nr:transglycosylase SLT domain-containing protein [Xanthomonadales bacterium]
VSAQAAAKPAPVPAPAVDTAQRQAFKQAWQAARRGDRAQVQQLSAGLQGYVLYPYLRYDDYLARRASIDPAEMATFLSAHQDWAFHKGLRRAWLRSQGEAGRWDALLQHADPSIDTDTEVQCYYARARIKRQKLDGLLAQAQDLWAVGKSQPDACDPVFDWLKKVHGITPELAWLRVGRAMQERNPRLTLYLARFLSADDKTWLERWQQQDSAAYLRLDRSRSWPNEARGREIVGFGLQQLARKDADRAWQLYPQLADHFSWNEAEQGAILREIAMWSAVAGASDATIRMRSVPPPARDDKLLEWWARSGLATQNWAEVVLAVDGMTPESKSSERWQYWDARARMQLGDEGYAQELLENLARQANYHGFLAADLLGFPYAICPQPADLDNSAIDAFAARPEVLRSLELQQVDLKNWSRSEWSLITKRMSAEDLRLAAALATREGWYYEAIVALAGSGELQWYDWRFPMAYARLVEPQANKRNLDPAWVMGLMRSESAMAADAVSPADARGLMQVMPGTARQIAKRNSYKYSGTEQLMQAETNILFGTTFLREMMDKFNNNPVLVTGAYNAGPGAVERWLQSLPGQDATIWIEILPYYETRDYIPRVLAFTTIYNYLLNRTQPEVSVARISGRMPPPDEAVAVQPKPAAATIACPVAAVARSETR